MSDLGWKINRLRRMGGAEIAFRLRRAIVQTLEKIFVFAGWQPALHAPVTLACNLVPTGGEMFGEVYRGHQFDDEILDNICHGVVDLFGYQALDFHSPVDWRLDPLTGISSPLVFGKELDYRDDALVGNVKVVWELARHQHLIPLAVAYCVTGKEQYKAAIVAQVQGWIDTNPYGLGIHWSSSLESALRLISWSIIGSLIEARDGKGSFIVSFAQPESLSKSIYQHCYFIRHYLSRFSSANNHLIGELTGLFVACCVFDMGPEGGEWRRFAQQELIAESEIQVSADGVDKEQAFYYHLWVLEYLFFAWLVGKRSGNDFPDDFMRRIDAMAGFLRDITPSHGMVPQVGDADDGVVARFTPEWPSDPYADVLTSVDLVLHGRCSTRDIPAKAFWYAQVAGISLPQSNCTANEPAAAGQFPKVYPAGGYAVLGGKGMHLLFDAGSLGYTSIAAHGHADALSFCFSDGATQWLVDPGTYSYHSEQQWRNYFRGTSAHNTVRVDSRDQSEIAGPFMWSRHAAAELLVARAEEDGTQVVIGKHDGYQDIGVGHTRKLSLSLEHHMLDVEDCIEGEGRHLLEIYFHFHPDIKLEQIANDEWLASCKSTARQLKMKVDPALEWEAVCGSESPVLGWYSSALGHKIPAVTLRGKTNKALPVNIRTSLFIK